MAVTLKATPQGLQRIEESRKVRGWRATEKSWYKDACTTLATLKRFRAGEPIQRDVFIRLCEALGLSWEDIADLMPTQIARESEFKLSISNALALNDLDLVSKTLTAVALDKGSKNLLDVPSNELVVSLSKAFQKYAQTYINRHGILKVLGMREPVNLDDVYTNVRLLNESSIRDFISMDALETAFRESGQRRLQQEKGETWLGVEVASEQQFLMVLGQPGAGKSTFLRKMGLEALKGKAGNYKHRCIPVFLELKRFDDVDVSIMQRITTEFETCGFSEPEKFTTEVLEHGKLLILFDGLDEVPNKTINAVIEQIQDFVDRYDQNRFIASCRTAAYRSSFRRFKDVVVADFDDQQIQQYIENWFSSEQDKAEETEKYCWELLQQEEQQGAKELAQTPLLLTFLCLIYDRSQQFSSNRSVLYRKALRILLEEWAAEKRINRDKIYEGLHTELEEMLLAEIAYNNYVEEQLFFEKSELVDHIRSFLGSNLNAPEHIDAESILNAIAVQQGILVERAEEIYSFSHLTLQEYLTAQYIVDIDNVEAIVEKNLFNKDWKEVFLLIASMMRGKGADRLLLIMIELIEKLLIQPSYKDKLLPILQWSESETKDAGGGLSLLSKRSIFNSYAYAVANANANAKANANSIAMANFNADTDINPNITNAIANATENDIYNTNAIANAYINVNTNNIAKAYALAIANANSYVDSNANVNNTAIRYFTYYYKDISRKKSLFADLNISKLLQNIEDLKIQISQKKYEKKEQKFFAKKLIKTILDFHNFPEELAQTSREDLKNLDSYYYATYLLIQCKEAAMRVSPETWAAIEDRMLRVPDHLRPVEPTSQS